MAAEVQVTIGGEEHTLALPIGGIEEVAKVNPQVEEVWQALHFTLNNTRVYRLDELKAVLTAGCKWGKAKVKPEQIIEELGVRPAADVAAELMRLALGIEKVAPSGKGHAAERTTEPGS